MLWVELINLINYFTDQQSTFCSINWGSELIQACQTIPWMKPKPIHLKCGDIQNFIIHCVYFRK